MFRLITIFAILSSNCSFAQISVSGMPEDAANTMYRQQEAWNSGDLESFMVGYLKSDSLLFIGGSAVTTGYNATLDRYKKGYPNKEAMGHLEFTNRSWTKLSRNYALLIGAWSLNNDDGGMYTLVWHRIKGEWLIIADHSSSD